MLPILFQNSSFVLYSYPLFMGLGWGIAYQIFFDIHPPELSRGKAQFLFWGIFLSAWIGAKLLFYLTLPPDLSAQLVGQVSFWTGGGFVFYGGVLAAMLFLGLYHWLVHSLSFALIWSILPALAIGHGIGRIGCLLAGCCFGEVTDLFWGIPLHGEHRHPTQLIEAVGLVILGLHLLRSRLPKSHLVIHYLLGYGTLRFGLEFLRGDIIRGNWGWLTPSQWISLGLLLLAGALLMREKSRTYP